jgi:hypothetical protein
MSKQPFTEGQPVASKMDHAGVNAGTVGKVSSVEQHNRRWWVWVRMPTPRSILSGHTLVGYWASELYAA